MEQLRLWRTFGNIDEQNIESTHPIFNLLLRRFSNLRGDELKKRVVRQFLFERASFIREGISEILKKTERKKHNKPADGAKEAEAVSADGGGTAKMTASREDADGADGNEGDADGAEMKKEGADGDEGGAVNAGDVDDADDADDVNLVDLGLSAKTTVLNEQEAARNENEDLHPKTLADADKVKINHTTEQTHVVCCKKCGMRILGVARDIHMQEHHMMFVLEADGAVE